MKILKIYMKNFRGFKGEYFIDLNKGSNLLIYGENGSGKSSLFQALDLFFSINNVSFSEYQNIFAEPDDGYIKLEIGDLKNKPLIYEWEPTTHPSSESIIVDIAKTKGFLDYRSLLVTHFDHRNTDYINIFGLIVNILLANIISPISKRPLGEEWIEIEKIMSGRKGKHYEEMLTRSLSDFVPALTILLEDVAVNANRILEIFEQDISISFKLDEQEINKIVATKNHYKPMVSLSATYFKREIHRHHFFLNEARLSAIAISIYLGSLLLNPPSRLRILFLDDILLGLDMSNRIPLLSVLNELFSDWQILLATFDRTWFEIIKQRVNGQRSTWKACEFYCDRTDECDIPVYAESYDYISAAKRHIHANDFKATAIYIRSAYENEIKWFCNKHHLNVRYFENPKDQKSDIFWQAIKEYNKSQDPNILSQKVIDDTELYRTTVLNKLSHVAPIDITRKEVEDALKIVEILRNSLRSYH